MSKVLLKDSVLYSLSSFLSKGLGFLMLPFYTQVLSPSDYGIMDMVAVVSVLVTNILSLQVNQSLFRFYIDEADPRRKTGYFSTALAYHAVIFLFLVLPVMVFRDAISSFLFDDASYGFIIALAVVTLFFTAVYTIASSLYRLEFEAKKYTVLSLSYTVVSIGLIVACVLFFDDGLVGVFTGQLLANLLFTLLLTGKVWRAFDQSTVSLRFFKIMTRYGVPLVPVALMLVAIQYVDRMMITHMIGIESLGLYAIAMKIASVLALLFSGFRLAWGPYVFANYRDPQTAKTMAALFYYLCVLSLLLIAALTLFSADIMRIMASPPFYEAYVLFPYLLLATLFFTLGAEFSVGFALANRNEIQAIVYFVTIVLNVILNYVLIMRYGLIGAAMATFIAFLAGGIVSLYLSGRFYPVAYPLRRLMVHIGYFVLMLVCYGVFVRNEPTLSDFGVKCALLGGGALLLYMTDAKPVFGYIRAWRQERA